jgi:plasmid stability protein
VASLTVRNIPDDAKRRFRQVAAMHGRSMEEHLRQLVVAASSDDGPTPRGVRDVTQPFRHFEPAPAASTGSAVIDRLLELGRYLDFEPPKRKREKPREIDFL